MSLNFYSNKQTVVSKAIVQLKKVNSSAAIGRTIQKAALDSAAFDFSSGARLGVKIASSFLVRSRAYSFHN